MEAPNESLKDNYNATSQETGGPPLGNLILFVFYDGSRKFSMLGSQRSFLQSSRQSFAEYVKIKHN